LTENQLRGNKKQASQVMDKPLGGPLARAERSGDGLPEVFPPHEGNDVKLFKVNTAGLVETNDHQSRNRGKDDMRSPSGDNPNSPGRREPISLTDKTENRLQKLLENHKPKIW
jgi:hypothetical protein